MNTLCVLKTRKNCDWPVSYVRLYFNELDPPTTTGSLSRMKNLFRLKSLVRLSLVKRLTSQSLALMVLLFILLWPLASFAEVVYICAPAVPITTGPWPLDIDANGVPDLTLAVAGQDITLLPASGNSVLANNFSYYTNISNYPQPVLVGQPDEVAALVKGEIVSFFNPTKPFWRERLQIDSQPLLLPMAYLPIGAGSSATNYFALKIRAGSDWILAWVRVRLTAAPDATCALDWGYDQSSTPLLVDDIIVGARPTPATIRAVKKACAFPLVGERGIDLDGDGTTDLFLSELALTTLADSGITTNGNPIGGQSISLSASVTMNGRNEILRDSQFAWIFQNGDAVAEFRPAGTYWEGDSALLASTMLSANTGWTGHLAEQGDGYLGVRVYRDHAYYYGWLHAQLPASTLAVNEPGILDWAIETRPDVPIAAGVSGVAGAAVLSPPVLVGGQTLVDVSGLSQSTVILTVSEDLLHWAPLVTNTVPFKCIFSTGSGKTRYFQATVEN
jgi:hypothetical protein